MRRAAGADGPRVRPRRVFLAVTAAMCCAGAIIAQESPTSDRGRRIPNSDAAANEKLYVAIRGDDLRALTALLDNGAKPNAPDARGNTPLIDAARIGSVEAMRLLLDRGANVNAQNAFGYTALMASGADVRKATLLLDRGADARIASSQGMTALIAAAGFKRSSEAVRLLLDRGADPRAAVSFGMTAAHAAAEAGDLDTLRLLLDRGVDANIGATGSEFGTPLFAAVQGRRPDVVAFLLARGANPNAIRPRAAARVKNGPIDAGLDTPLTIAAAYGPPALVGMLLDAGADVSARDVRGMTPLMFAVATDQQNPDVIRLLLARGADTSIRSRDGQTALDWARTNGAADGISLLGGGASGAPRETSAASQAAVAPERGSGTRTGLAAASTAARATRTAPDVRAALTRSTALLERTATSSLVNGGCPSCHAQPAAHIAAAGARAKGIATDDAAAAVRTQLLVGMAAAAPFGARGEALLYAIEALRAAESVPERIGDGLAVALLPQQDDDGSWRGIAPARTPLQDGDFTMTGLAVRTIAAYTPPSRRADGVYALGRARQWLERSRPITVENHAMRLVGMAAAGAAPTRLREAAEPIVARQRADGGWGQREELASDAYATGVALWALAEAGVVKPTDSVYRRAVAFLLSTQAEDGSWHVSSRAVRFQPYFESGFPYGHDQWISSMATGWAAAALARRLE